VKVWDLATCKAVATYKGHKNQVHSVCFSPDGNLLVSASADCTVRIWNLKEGGGNPIIVRHPDEVMDVVISPESRFIVSGCLDSTIRLWDLCAPVPPKRGALVQRYFAPRMFKG
jgi:WD40 repeat protein